MNWRSSVVPKAFYDRDPARVAQDLLGKFLVRKLGNELLAGRIVEVEAYLPSGDSAAHNFKGRTKRNESLYKSGGHAYVHSMRQYCLIDIVTEGHDKPGSVLIRALEPIEGIDYMKELRGDENVGNLTNGPGKVCMALHITRDLDGIDLTDPESVLYVAAGTNAVENKIIVSERIGISQAKDMPLRFYLSDNTHVSRKR